MIAHWVRHHRTLDGTAGWFGSIGFRDSRLQARASAAVEVGSGTGLLLGAATPLSAAAVVGTMGVAAHSVHRSNGFFVTAEGWEYVMNLAVAAVALASLGPGRWSIDRAVSLDGWLTGRAAAGVAAGVGLLGSALHLAAYYRRPARTGDL